MPEDDTAVSVIAYVLPVPAAGVPLSTPLAKVTPAGSVPDSVNVGAGKPEAVGVKLPAWPTTKLVVELLVNAAA